MASLYTVRDVYSNCTSNGKKEGYFIDYFYEPNNNKSKAVYRDATELINSI